MSRYLILSLAELRNLPLWPYVRKSRHPLRQLGKLLDAVGHDPFVNELVSCAMGIQAQVVVFPIVLGEDQPLSSYFAILVSALNSLMGHAV